MADNKLSPLRSVHAFCIECQGSGVVANSCPTVNCTLYPFRKGSVKRGECTGPVLGAIRKQCLKCVGGERGEIDHCTASGARPGMGQPHYLCTLYPYRSGKNPRQLTEAQLRQRRDAIIRYNTRRNDVSERQGALSSMEVMV